MKVEIENAQQNDQVDWTKNPQLVIYKGLIILVNENQNDAESDNHFVGTDLKNSDFCNGWVKDLFKPFYGKITLSND